MKIAEHISALLFEHDCVIVPDFGGFVCNYAPARIDPVKHLFEPPSKRIIFNKGLTRNDGLLAHYVSGKLKMSYSETIDLIAKEVKNYKEELQKDKRLTLENIGLIYTDEKGVLLFQQDNNRNYLAESFGLSAFYHQPVEADQAEKTVKVIPIYNERKKTRGYAAAAVITVLAASAFVFTLIMEKQNRMSLSSFDFFSKKEAPQYVFSPSRYRDLPKPLAETTMPAATNNTTPVSIVNNAVPVPASASFSVIVGSFSIKENADKLVNEFIRKNVHVSIIGRNPQGLYIVGYGKFTSHDAASAERDKLRNTLSKDAWVKAN
jgi:hypothetical protein